MNKQMKKDLESVVNAVINEDTDKAVSSFKQYLKEKTREILESGEDFEMDRSRDSRFDDDDFDDEEYGIDSEYCDDPDGECDDDDSDEIDYDEHISRLDREKYGDPRDSDYTGPGSKGWAGH